MKQPKAILIKYLILKNRIIVLIAHLQKMGFVWN